MFSDTLNRVIQGAGTHPPVRMTPVRELHRMNQFQCGVKVLYVLYL